MITKRSLLRTSVVSFSSLGAPACSPAPASSLTKPITEDQLFPMNLYTVTGPVTFFCFRGARLCVYLYILSLLTPRAAHMLPSNLFFFYIFFCSILPFCSSLRPHSILDGHFRLPNFLYPSRCLSRLCRCDVVAYRK